MYSNLQYNFYRYGTKKNGRLITFTGFHFESTTTKFELVLPLSTDALVTVANTAIPTSNFTFELLFKDVCL